MYPADNVSVPQFLCLRYFNRREITKNEKKNGREKATLSFGKCINSFYSKNKFPSSLFL